MNFMILWMYLLKEDQHLNVCDQWVIRSKRKHRFIIFVISSLSSAVLSQFVISSLSSADTWTMVSCWSSCSGHKPHCHWSLVTGQAPMGGVTSVPLLPLDNGHLNWPMPPLHLLHAWMRGEQQEKLQCFRVGINFCFSLSKTASACTVVLTSAGNVRFYTHQQ